MNCTKEQSWEIVNKYWEREWNKIQQIEFPRTREHDITDKECSTELVNLKNGIKSNKTASKTIIKCHRSLIYANKGDRLSPYDYWQKLKHDPELFKQFYENRLRCSDWFNEKNGKNFHYLQEGYVPEFIYGIGLTTSGKAPVVSYFKPALAKNIILKYLNDYDTIFDPCSGYSGRLIGTLCAGKNYIGQDINDITIEESVKLYQYIRPIFPSQTCTLNVADIFNSCGKYPCLFTCTPYKNTEEWTCTSGKITSNLSCDEWIDVIIDRFNCEKYIFVTDDDISKYTNCIVTELENTSHFGKNKEYIVEIHKRSRNNNL